MKKFVNVRLPLVCALSLSLGIFSFHKLLFGNVVPFVVCCSAAILAAVIFACLRKKYWKFCLVALAFVLVGFFDYFAVYCYRNENETVVEKGVLSGRVTDLGHVGVSHNTVYLEDCTFEGEQLSGRVMIYVYDGSQYSVGDRVSVYGTLRNAYAVKEQPKTSYIRHDIRYELESTDNWIVQSGELTLSERVRQYVYETSSEYMSQNADVAYALLTGDRNTMSDEKEDSFTEAGIVHLLTVSGLHVGFVVAVFGFFLRRFRLHAAIELAILLVPMIFYAYICDFAPSVVRAVVMTVCVYLSKMIHGHYDLMTSLSVAALVILLVQPLYFFDVGFRLSFLSVFGIATIYLQTDRWLNARKFNKFVKKLLQVVALSSSCVISTMLLSASVFESFVWFGIFTNIVAIPLVFVAFVLSIFGLLPWVFGYLLVAADAILQVVTDVALFVSDLGLTLPARAFQIGVVISMLLLFVAGGYVNISAKTKRVVYGVCILAMSCCVGFAFVPQTPQNSVTVFCGFDDVSVVATSANGEAAVVCSPDGYNSSQIIDYLDDFDLKSVVLYITDSTEVDSASLEDLCDKLNVEKVYSLDRHSEDGFVSVLEKSDIPYARASFNEIYGDDVTVQSVYDGGLSGAVVKVGNVGVAAVFGGEEKTRHFADLRRDVGIYAVSCAEDYYSQLNLPTLSMYQQNVFCNFGANKYGNFTITEKDDILKMNFWGN